MQHWQHSSGYKPKARLGFMTVDQSSNSLTAPAHRIHGGHQDGRMGRRVWVEERFILLYL